MGSPGLHLNPTIRLEHTPDLAAAGQVCVWRDPSRHHRNPDNPARVSTTTCLLTFHDHASLLTASFSPQCSRCLELCMESAVPRRTFLSSLRNATGSPGRSSRTITKWSGAGAGCGRRSASAAQPTAVRRNARCSAAAAPVDANRGERHLAFLTCPFPVCAPAAGFIGVKIEAPAPRHDAGRGGRDSDNDGG